MKFRDQELLTIIHALQEQLAITRSALTTHVPKNPMSAARDAQWRHTYTQRELAIHAILTRIRKNAARSLARMGQPPPTADAPPSA